MDLSLAGLTVLVTGGSTGIGRAVVEEFARERANVSFSSDKAYEAGVLEEQLEGSVGRIEGFVVDPAHPGALARWVSQTMVLFGGVDIVVSAASALAFEDTDENWEASLAVDLMGSVRLVKAALPHLELSTAPCIVVISSTSGREADFAAGPYATAKTAVAGYVAGLAFRLAGRGIRANVVSAGNTYYPGSYWSVLEERDPATFDAAVAMNPTGRMGTPEEVADVVAFIASPRASRITGANILVDGGLSRGVQL
ncbi:SDR family NAD(P)-dependent oxidoreductase [Arthrobacter citreus]|uniref:SDR family NAD(P)-dependent oxidoreductase n=1 Tax=Arthrobacter TaxID=1663 RepID=UPI0012647913|nr:SDR family oxidoreductase [Arthrobacter gandavensis]